MIADARKTGWQELIGMLDTLEQESMVLRSKNGGQQRISLSYYFYSDKANQDALIIVHFTLQWFAPVPCFYSKM